MSLDPRQLQSLRILHLALMGSLAIYGAIAFIAVQAPDPTWTHPTYVILYVLAGLGLTMAVVVVPMVKRIVLPEGEQNIAKLRTGYILVWALCESIGVNGLLAAFLYHEPIMFLPFGAAALGMMVLNGPRKPQPG